MEYRKEKILNSHHFLCQESFVQNETKLNMAKFPVFLVNYQDVLYSTVDMLHPSYIFYFFSHLFLNN